MFSEEVLSLAKDSGAGYGALKREYVVGITAFIALGLWWLRRVNSDGGRPKPPTTHAGDSKIAAKDAEKVHRVTAQYNSEYQERMKQMLAPPTSSNAKPFLGFSLADNIKEGALVVDGVFESSPAGQVNIQIDHELVAVADEVPSGIAGVRTLIAKHCKPGHITTLTMRDHDGKEYKADLWVMTNDVAYEGKPYFFDVTAHRVIQSDRLKRTC